MDSSLKMSLDDIIKSKKSAGRGRGRGIAPRGRGDRGGFLNGGRMRGEGRGSGHLAPLGVNTRPSSSAIAKTSCRPKNFPWQRDLLEESLTAAGLPGIESGTKLNISNLDSGVSNNDIRELFSEIGELKRYAIHFDKSGRPSGSAEVVYAKRSVAFAAHKRYNNVQLDGKPMKIEVVSPNAEVPVSARINVVGGANGKATRRVTMTGKGKVSLNRLFSGIHCVLLFKFKTTGFQCRQGRLIASAPTYHGSGQKARGGLRNIQGRAQNQGRGLGRGQGKRGGRGRGRGKKQEKSAEELDKELETYHAEGMNVDI